MKHPSQSPRPTLNTHIDAANAALSEYIGAPPETLRDTEIFLERLPGLFRATAAAVDAVARRLHDEQPVKDEVTGHLGELAALAAGQQEYAAETYRLFQAHYRPGMEEQPAGAAPGAEEADVAAVGETISEEHGGPSAVEEAPGNEEAVFTGPQGVYLPEKVDDEVIALTAHLTRWRLSQFTSLEHYSPAETKTTPFHEIDEAQYAQVLGSIERDLAAFIPFDEFDKDNPKNPKNPIFPRCQILLRALMAGAIQDSITEGFMERAAEIIRRPELVDESIEDHDRPLHNVRLAMARIYREGQKASRHKIALSGDPDKIKRYAALDGLMLMLSRELGAIARIKSKRVTAMEREMQGFQTAFVDSTGNLLRRIHADVVAIGNGAVHREPHDDDDIADHVDHQPEIVPYPAVLQSQVRERLAGLSGVDRETAQLELASNYLRASITTNAHTLMDLKIEQLLIGLGVFIGFGDYAALTEPLAKGDRIVWSQARLARDDTVDHKRSGDIIKARKWADPGVNTRCPARMPFKKGDGPAEFHKQFGAGVDRRFSRSPADATLHIVVESFRAYLLHRLSNDVSPQTVADYIK